MKCESRKKAEEAFTDVVDVWLRPTVFLRQCRDGPTGWDLCNPTIRMHIEQKLSQKKRVEALPSRHGDNIAG